MIKLSKFNYLSIPVLGVTGAVIGGVGAYLLVDAFDEELEAFTQWSLF